MTLTTTKRNSLSVFGTKPRDAIFNPRHPYAVRNDCKLGMWKVGDDDRKGDVIEISIIAVKELFGTLGKTKNATWLQVWFIPAPNTTTLPANTVCMTYIKSRSLTGFSEKITELMQSGEPAEGIFIAGFQKHSGDHGDYYSVTWDWRERETPEELEQLEKIAEFMCSHPRLVDVGNAQNLVSIDGYSDDEVAVIIEAKKQEFAQLEAEKKAAK